MAITAERLFSWVGTSGKFKPSLGGRTLCESGMRSPSFSHGIVSGGASLFFSRKLNLVSESLSAAEGSPKLISSMWKSIVER